MKHREPAPVVQQNGGKDNTGQGESQTLLIRVLWKYSSGSLVTCCKMELKCTFLLMEARQEMSRGGEHR